MVRNYRQPYNSRVMSSFFINRGRMSGTPYLGTYRVQISALIAAVPTEPLGFAAVHPSASCQYTDRQRVDDCGIWVQLSPGAVIFLVLPASKSGTELTQPVQWVLPVVLSKPAMLRGLRRKQFQWRCDVRAVQFRVWIDRRVRVVGIRTASSCFRGQS